MNAAVMCHPVEKQLMNTLWRVLIHLIHQTWHRVIAAISKVKMTMKAKCSESIQDIEAGTTVQLNILMKEDFLSCFKKQQE